MAAKERVVNLSVKAKDDFSKVFKNLEAAGRKAQLTFVRDTAKAVKDTQAEIRMLSIEIDQLSKASGDNAAALAKMSKEKATLIAQASKLSTNLDQVLNSVRQTSNGGVRSFNGLVSSGEAVKQKFAEIHKAAQAGSGFAAFSKMASNMDVSAARADRLRQEIKDVSAEIGRLTQAQRGMSAVNPFAAADIGKQASAYLSTAKNLKSELAQLEASQHKASGTTQGSFLAFSRAADGLRQYDTAADAAAAATAAVVPTLKQKEVATNKAAAADREHAKAIDLVGRATDRMRAESQGSLADIRGRNKGKKGDDQEVEVMGLKPWQLTNLGYQVNDVVSGLAMGQAPVQILAQQAGQFAQIWPNVMVGLARSLPLWGGLAAVLTPVIAAMSRTASETAALKSFTSELALSADGARYSAQALVDVAKEARNAGMAFDDARTSISAFVGAGISQSNIAPMLDMAKQLAKVTGESVPEASQRLAEAFGGNVSDVRELDRELNFLTADQYEQIRSMDAAGDRAGALTAAQDALAAKLKSTVQPATEWQSALKELKTSWNELVTAIQDSGIVELGAKALGILALSAKGAATIVSGAASLFEEETPAERLDRLNAKRTSLQQQMADQQRSDTAMFGPMSKSSGEMARLQAELRLVEAEYKEVVALSQAASDNQAVAATAAAATADASEDQKKALLDVDAVVQQQAKSLQEQYDTAILTSREQFIQNQLLEARNVAMAKAVELGVAFSNLTAEQTELIRSQAGALFDRNQSVDLQGNLSSFVNKVVGVESGGDPNAKNPKSSATGLGQFIESTWLKMFKQYFPDRAAGMTNAAILELRKESALSKKMVELYAQENAKVLQGAGAAVTEASLYLAHFLGPGGATAVMKAEASTPVSQILGADQINANQSILAGKTAGEVRAWSEKKMGISTVEVDAALELAEIDADRAEDVADYNKGYKERLADQQFELELARQTARDAAIAKAIREEELEAQKAGVSLSQQQRDEIAATTGKLFDQQNVETEVNKLLEERAIIQERLSMAKASGDQSDIATATSDLAELDTALTAAIDKAIAFWEAMGGEGAKLAIANLELHKQKVKETADAYQTQYIPTAEELNEKIAESGSNALSTFAQEVAAGEASFKSFFAAVSAGLGQFLIDIGQAIMKQMILNAVSGGSAGGGAGAAVSSWIAAVLHDGGIAGNPGTARMVNPAVFAGATRYHTGGIAGLKPNEVPAILEDDEEVITSKDPRHRDNGGGQKTSVKVLNVLDPAEIFERALATEVGETILLNFMSNRARQINGLLGG